MRDGIGSVVMIGLIIFFITAVSAFLAFNVNYTKAFRMKNKVLSVYDEHDGQCASESDCLGEIDKYAHSIGYLPVQLNCASGYVAKSYGGKLLFCEKCIEVEKEFDDGGTGNIDSYGVLGDKIVDHYYSIYTVININIPVFNNLFSPKLLGVYGDTRAFKTGKCQN